MKRKITLLCAFTAFVGAMVSCSSNTFKIDGTAADEIPDTAYFVFISDENYKFSEIPDDTIIIKDKKFSYTNNKFNEPRLINLQAIFKDGTVCNNIVDFIMVPGETAKLKVCNGFYQIDGTRFYNDWHNISVRQDSLRTQMSIIANQLNSIDYNKDYEKYDSIRDIYETTYNEYSNLVSNYLKKNPKAEGAFIPMLFSHRISFSAYSNVISDDIRNGRFSRYIDSTIVWEKRSAEENRKMRQKQIDMMAETAEGTMYKELVSEIDGKKLSDYVGRGKYVLVDFWASWCGPCRQEIPSIIEIYNNYKGKDFDVVGVTISDRPEDTQRAVEELGIPYPQIMTTSWENPYGVNGIPHTILFAPDGRIVKRGMRGDGIELWVLKSLMKNQK